MSFSLPDFRRKWSCRGYMSAGAAMVTAALGLSLVLAERAEARKYRCAAGYLRPRYTTAARGGAFRPGYRYQSRAPRRPPRQRTRPRRRPEESLPPTSRAPTKPAEAAPPPEKQASACRLALTEEIAVAPSIPDIRGPGACGGEDLVRLEAIVLPDKRKVAVKPAAILRCTMASAIADWVRTDMVPLATSLGSTISDLDNFDSASSAAAATASPARMLSEHGKANALDVRAIKLANGQSIGLTDRSMPRDVRERVLHSVCARFSTVLGPGSDWYHEDHIHLDLAQRRNDYRICQWNVWDPLPQVAPLLPAGRPEEAPPREVAAKPEAKDGAKDEGRRAGAESRLRRRTKSAADAGKAEPRQAGNKKAPVKPALLNVRDQEAISSCPPGRSGCRRARGANCRASRRASARAPRRWCRP